MTYQILGQWTRCFTEIPGLQQAHEISYSAGWSDSGMQIRITLSMQRSWQNISMRTELNRIVLWTFWQIFRCFIGNMKLLLQQAE